MPNHDSSACRLNRDSSKVPTNAPPIRDVDVNILAGRRILVVEDAFLIALDLRDQLERCGCTVAGPVGRLRQALDIAQHETLDGAVLDVNLAGEPSFPVAATLDARNIPYVFLTGYDDDGAFPPEYRNVVRISKPFRSSDIAPMLTGYFSPRGTGSKSSPTDAYPGSSPQPARTHRRQE